MILVECNHCGAKVYRRQDQIKRNKHNFCSPTCYHNFRKGKFMGRPRKRVDRTCEWCNKEFEIIPSWLKSGGGRFCSRDCMNEWKRSITGPEHPLYKEPAKIVCDFCGIIFETKPSLANRSRFCSRSCHGSWRVRNTQSPTDIEIITANILHEIGKPFEEQKGIGSYLCDFFLPAYNLVIESDGIYWHGLENVKQRDKRKDKWLNSQGYNVLRLRGDDIRERPDWCKAKIIKHLY